ncbi:DedA family protein [Rhodoblastus acidophilus]|uniref:DedA family protein n=1 Tax=Rhodoblastus acidophilus TaxID=1074 RepID=A0A6N8DK17_RHOAC|nr:DedA family protein [Rhodoblastus acidophilus]MCW2274095.1 membrane protein DedA with SNARE-associated domain [Rhodoblastus acidophilus]MTV30668.1 DedA family protein [Rhodoblastus acidophilus]
MPDFHSLLTQFGPWVVFFLVAVESAGIPLPGETSLVTAAVIVGSSQQGSIAEIVALAAAGAIVGDNIGFWVGREFGLRLLLAHGPKIGLDEDRLRLGQYLFQRYGGAIVFFGRFVAVLRAFAAVLAGANKMSPLRFFLFNAAGGITWASIFGLGGYFLGAEFHRIAGPFGLAALALAVTGFFLFSRYLRQHEARLIAEAKAALPGPLGLATQTAGR